MRGPKLVGSPPTGIRWSRDSSKIYFTWQQASEERSSTYVVNRDGTSLKKLTTEEARTIDAAPAGRLDRARRRVLATENGDVVTYDTTTGERRQLTRTAAVESSPRWIRNDTAITFVPTMFDVAEGDPRLAGAIVEVDAATGRATAIRRIMLDEKAVAALAGNTPSEPRQ